MYTMFAVVKKHCPSLLHSLLQIVSIRFNGSTPLLSSALHMLQVKAVLCLVVRAAESARLHLLCLHWKTGGGPLCTIHPIAHPPKRGVLARLQDQSNQHCSSTPWTGTRSHIEPVHTVNVRNTVVALLLHGRNKLDVVCPQLPSRVLSTVPKGKVTHIVPGIPLQCSFSGGATAGTVIVTVACKGDVPLCRCSMFHG